MQPNQQPQEEVNNLDTKRIQDIKYKIYIFVVLVIGWLAYPYISDVSAQVQNLRQTLSDTQNQIVQTQTRLTEAQKDMETISYIEKNKSQVMDCVNNKSCQNKDILDKLDQVRNYILISKNSSAKMDFDQKRMLSNISEFLIRDLGDINIITFGIPSVVDQSSNFYKVPVTISVDVTDRDKMLEILANVEDKVPAQNGVFYKIDSLSYDIVNYTQNPTLLLTMSAYFYK